MSRNVRVNRRRQNEFGVLFIMLFLSISISATAAGVWHMMTPPPDQNYLPILPSEAIQKLPESSIENSSSMAIQQQSISEPPVVKAEFGIAVPENERVRSEYFDDAVFIGDSITTGISLYDVMANTTVLASTGINLQSVFTKEVIKQGDGSVTIFDALKTTNPAKIYIMLGANSISQMDDDWIIEQYKTVIEQVKSIHPNAIIYVQSVMPINEEIFHVKYNTSLNNEKIDAINQKLLSLTKECQVYFVDLSTVFKDETGGLPKTATPDGLHIKSEWYIKWFDYLKTHTVGQN